MNLFAFLFVASAIMGLVAYDYNAYGHAMGTIEDIDQISDALSIRVEQQHKIQIHYIDLVTELLNKNQELDSPTGSIFYRSYSLDNLSVEATSWPDFNILLKTSEKLRETILTHSIHFSDSVTTSSKLTGMKLKTDSLILQLNELQGLYIKLLDYLSSRLVRQLISIVTVNVILIFLIFLFTFLVLYWRQAVAVSRNKATNLLLEKRHQEMLGSKRLLVSIMQDLSTERNMALSLTTKLEDVNKKILLKNEEMEQFIYTVSHDLKSPLVSIGGFTQILLNELTEKLSDKQSHLLGRIKENVRSMELLLGDLLELSRVTQQKFVKSQIDVEEVIAKRCDLLAENIKEASADITVKTPLARIYANRRLLSQCLSNLIANAIQYRDTKRRLQIDIWTEQDNSFVTLIIKDNGIGVEEKYHKLIFRIFERLETGKGTGVGLTIVKTVMEKHGGEVVFESQPGVGSCFYLKFPHSTEIGESN